MNRYLITIRSEIYINKSREEVWDYTQNYHYRKRWDKTVADIISVNNESPRSVRLKLKGGSEMTFVYKLDERPLKTSLSAENVISPLFERAGGSWLYLESDAGTLWIIANSIELKKKYILLLIKPFIRLYLKRETLNGLKRLKKLVESDNI